MFVPRHPVVENQFCSYAANTSYGSTGTGQVVAYAGSVVYLNADATNQEAMVKAYHHAADYSEMYPFGFLMQKVKVGYHSVHPTGMVLPGDLGSSDAIAQPTYDDTGAINGHGAVPVGVAHLGIYDTVHYICKCESEVNVPDTDYNMKPGMALYPANSGKVTNSTTDSDSTADTAGERCGTVAVARVVKGASSAKCEANMKNTTLYPIRIKLLV